MSENNKEFIRLKERIEKQFKKKKLIGDIPINDREYSMLLEDCRNKCISIINSDSHRIIDILFTFTLIEIGIRKYDGSYWCNLRDELNLNMKVGYQKWIGESVIDTLKYYNKIFIAADGGKNTINSIMVHSFVADKKAFDFFTFLYKFYVIDLERDISRNTTEVMRAFCDAVVNNQSSVRAYLLNRHTQDAIEQNPRGCKIRIRRLLKLIDRYFWEDIEEYKSPNRINNLLFSWMTTSDEFKEDYRQYYNKNTDNISFKSPILCINLENNEYSIRFPSELITDKQVKYNTNISWRVIIGDKVSTAEIYLQEAVCGYKTAKLSMQIDKDDIFKNIRIELTNNDTKEIIKKYNILADSFRLISAKGIVIKKEALGKGKAYALSKQDIILESPSLIEKNKFHGLSFYYFEFESNDFIKVSDGRIISIGKLMYEGIMQRGMLNNARALIKNDDEKYNVKIYNKYPLFAVKTFPRRINGSFVSINNNKYRFEELQIEQVCTDKSEKESGYIIRIPQEKIELGLNKVIIDIPNDKKNRIYEFVYIPDFKYKFDGEPYVFDRRGTIGFNKRILTKQQMIVDENDDDIKYFYNFEIKNTSDYFLCGVAVNKKAYFLRLDIPKFSYRFGNGNWRCDRCERIWYADLNTELEIKVPYEKVKITINRNDDKEFSQEFNKSSETGTIKCDLTKFLSYIDRDIPINKINVQFGTVNEKFFEIITKSYVRASVFSADYEKNIIYGDVIIEGKNDYYADILYGNRTIGEKIKLTDGCFELEVSDIDDGKYFIKLYEAEEDEFGFDTDYKIICTSEKELINPYNLNNMTFKVNSIEKLDDNLELQLKVYKYYLVNLKKINSKSYEAVLVMERYGNAMYANNVIITLKNSRDLKQMYVEFIEDDEKLEYIYDSKEKTIVEKENPYINKRECYRRYEFVLYKGEFLFNTELVELSMADINRWTRINGKPQYNIDVQLDRKINWSGSDKTNLMLNELDMGPKLFILLNLKMKLKTVKQVKTYCADNDISKIKMIGRRKKEEIYDFFEKHDIKLKLW